MKPSLSLPCHCRVPGLWCQPKGFTLLELLVAMGIIAMLTIMAYPSYEQHRQRLLLTEAKLSLSEIMTLQAQYFADHQSYTVDLVSDLGVAAEMGQAVSVNGNYHIQGEPCEHDLKDCCRLTAIARESGQVALTIDTMGRKHPSEAWQ